MVGLVRVVPIIGFSLLSGVVADAFDRRKLMMIAQTGMGFCALATRISLRVTEIPEAWPIYLFAALSSSFGAFDMPARQALIPSIVPREDLPNAFSLNATMFQAASVAGPAVGGAVLAHLGLHVGVLDQRGFVRRDPRRFVAHSSPAAEKPGTGED